MVGVTQTPRGYDRLWTSETVAESDMVSRRWPGRENTLVSLRSPLWSVEFRPERFVVL